MPSSQYQEEFLHFGVCYLLCALQQCILFTGLWSPPALLLFTADAGIQCGLVKAW